MRSGLEMRARAEQASVWEGGEVPSQTSQVENLNRIRVESSNPTMRR